MNTPKQLTELQNLPEMPDAEEREREVYEEDNVRQLLKLKYSPAQIVRKTGMTVKYISKVRAEMRKEGWIV